jgi:hypothetical protein
LYTALTAGSDDPHKDAAMDKLINKTNLKSHQFAVEIRAGDVAKDMYDFGNKGEHGKFIKKDKNHV